MVAVLEDNVSSINDVGLSVPKPCADGRREEDPEILHAATSTDWVFMARIVAAAFDVTPVSVM
jgi:hypothetical protein